MTAAKTPAKAKPAAKVTGPLIHERMAAIMADVPAIPKGQRNKAQGYAFRGIDDLYAALHPLFVKHEVVVLPEVLEADYVQTTNKNGTLMTDARLRIRYTFLTVDGSSVSIVVQGESRDAADKATNQAMSGAIKYGMLQVFLIPIDEPHDADGHSPQIEVATVNPVAEAKKRLVDILGSVDAASTFWNDHADGKRTIDDVLALAEERADEEARLQDSDGGGYG